MKVPSGSTVIWVMPPYHLRIVQYLLAQRLDSVTCFCWKKGVCYIMLPPGVDQDRMKAKLHGVEWFEER
jgi:hypothetical protein